MKSLPTDIETLILSFVDWRPHKMKVNRAVVTHGLVKAYMKAKTRRPHLSVGFSPRYERNSVKGTLLNKQ